MAAYPQNVGEAKKATPRGERFNMSTIQISQALQNLEKSIAAMRDTFSPVIGPSRTASADIDRGNKACVNEKADFDTFIDTTVENINGMIRTINDICERSAV